jgi:hypothetical protein
LKVHPANSEVSKLLSERLEGIYEFHRSI